MKKISLLAVLLLSILMAAAQSTTTSQISTTGTTSQNSNAMVDWTVGQTITHHGTDGNTVVSSGFQQGQLEVVSIAGPAAQAFPVAVYPNPVANELTIETPARDEDYRIFNQGGQLIKQGKIKAEKTQVDFSGLPSGSYFLQLNTNKTHKIIKH